MRRKKEFLCFSLALVLAAGCAPAGGDVTLLTAKAEAETEKHSAMEEIVVDAGGKIYRETPAVDLCLDDSGEIQGVYARGADGTIYQFNAPAVILCTGGFLQSEEWMDYFHLSYDRRDINSTPGHDGDGLRMAYSVGAASGNVCIMMLGPGLWGFSRDQDQIEYALTKTGALWVNQDGIRFCNEDIVTTNYTLAANAIMSQHEVWAIFDDAYINARATGGMLESTNDRKAGGALGKTCTLIWKRA